MDQTLELVNLIYDAVGDASKWNVFLERLVSAAGCRAGSMALFGSSTDETAVVCWHGWTDEDIQLHAERYLASDPWALPGNSLPEGAVLTTEQLCPTEEFEQSAAYREFYAPRNFRYGFGGMILRVGDKISAVTLARSSDDGPCGERETSILFPLMPHLRRAALLHGELSSLRARLSAFTGHLDRYPHAFLLVDAQACVLYANTAAREIAGANDGLTIESDRIVLQSPNPNFELRELLSAIATDRGASLQRLQISRPSGRTPYRLLLLPVPESGAMPLGVAQPAAALVLIDPEAGYEPDTEVLRELFSLTAAEAKIAAKLAQGRSVEEVAGETATSTETVRTHIRRVFAKTSTERQGELIALVLRSVPFRRFN
jgi:DNA-binding CsgD family transcriptional regulator